VLPPGVFVTKECTPFWRALACSLPSLLKTGLSIQDFACSSVRVILGTSGFVAA
jgi:hypothetical protein